MSSTETQQITLASDSPDELIKAELKKFNVTDAAIADLKGKYLLLKIKDVNDKAGYATVDIARKDVKKLRIAVTKKEQELNDFAKRYIKAVKEEANRITGELKIIEDHLQTEQDRIDEEKDRLKEEEARRMQELVQSRATLLMNNGCTFNGTVYNIGILSVTHTDLAKIDDVKFAQFLSEVSAVYAQVLEQKEEADRIAKEEADRVAAAKAELEKQQQELEEQRKDFERQQNELAAAKRQLAEARKAARTSALTGLGMKLWDGWYRQGRARVAESSIETATDEEWQYLLEEARSEVNLSNELISKRGAELLAAGLERQGTIYKHCQVEVSIPEDILYLNEEGWSQLLDEVKTDVARLKQLDVERQEALKTDKQKLHDLADQISKIIYPDVKDNASQLLVDLTKSRLSEIKDHLVSKINTL